MSQMDFDLSKENIQPLRGGRNVTQLGVAIQAQSNHELQRELLQQKEMFDNAIACYEGDDPLDNWYNYISWIEQSYPKHGHEGNLIPLLEHCLGLFENDRRYIDDRRFCKLWIKYIDLQQNPLELYQMMHARGLSRGCADLYRAWAYYHEAVGDYQSANGVFELGKQALARPFEELEHAHKSLVMAAGQHMLYGTNEERLYEKRQALTSLFTYKPGRVGSIRVPSTGGTSTGIYPSSTFQMRPNAPVSIYQDNGEEDRGAAAAPLSILTVAKKHEAPKENTLKAGPWPTVPVKKKMVSHHNPTFTVHEDDNCMVDQSLHMPVNFPTRTRETYVGWCVNLTIPEPADNRMIPMYPKSRVYADPTTEYSIEELRGIRYNTKKLSESPCTDQNMYISPVTRDNCFQQSSSLLPQHSFISNQVNLSNSKEQTPTMKNTFQQDPMSFGRPQHFDPFPNNCEQIRNSNAENRAMQQQNMSPTVECGVLWNSPENQTAAKQTGPTFTIYEQSHLQDQLQARGSAMKTPFKVLNADDLAETGSRGSNDVAAAAQPIDSASIKPNFDDSCNTQIFNFNLNEMKVSTPQPNRYVNCTGNSIDNGKIAKKQLFDDVTMKGEDKGDALSTIYEETKSYGSSSSSSSGTTKSTIFGNTKPSNMATISEEHNSYLAQNLMANEALRRSLGDLYPSHNPPVTQMDSSSIHEMSTSPIPAVSTICTPAIVVPLDKAPSDPFKITVIDKLLEVVSFPGPHTQEFFNVQNIPRLVIKKEPFYIGFEKFILEKNIGKGTFGVVFKAFNLRNNRIVALKYQKPANKWEFYICRELQARLSKSILRNRFMEVTSGYFSDQASLLVYDFMPYGTLLDLNNQVKLKNGKPMQECLCFYFCIEMLRIVEAMHQVQIIHADIKPDNFLIQLTPDNSIELQLIDFGCSIDMTLYPPNTTFTRKVTTENFICCEMQDGRPWNYHTDLFCIAATTHVILFDKYLELQKEYDVWTIKGKMPRYMSSNLWSKFFNTLLNQQSDVSRLQVDLNEALSSKFDKFTNGMRDLVNLVKNR